MSTLALLVGGCSPPLTKTYGTTVNRRISATYGSSNVRRLLALAIACVALASCSAAPRLVAPASTTSTSVETSSTTIDEAHRTTTSLTAPTTPLIFPNRALHPGTININVTQADIRSTICVKGWTATIRPPTNYTTTLKVQEISAEHLPGTAVDYEEDHLISLELGGNPTDPKNLWPEPWESKGARLAKPGAGAESKDRVENHLHAEVCAGTLPLATAQTEIATDWQTAK